MQAVVDAGTEILHTCIAMGGTISGEHGIGYEKRETLSLVFSTDDLAAMGNVRDVFDPRAPVQSRQDLPQRRASAARSVKR